MPIATVGERTSLRVVALAKHSALGCNPLWMEQNRDPEYEEDEEMADAYVRAQDPYKIVTLSDPRFSPDGRRLAYVRTEIDQESNGYKSAIWMSPVQGGRPRQFSSGTKRDHSPRWSPDGRWLAFVSNRGGDKAQIFVMATDGGEALPLTQAENGADNPVWSPDGR